MKIDHFLRHLAIATILVLGALAGASEVFAANAVNFTASVTNADGTLSTKLTWDAPGSSGCVASGHPSWTGNKPASGSIDLPAITMHGTYALLLTCSWAGDSNAVLTWLPVLDNTDGSVLTNLAGYTIYYGTSPTTLDKKIDVNNAGATTYTISGLAPGSWYFAIDAYNSVGVHGAPTAPPVTKTATGPQSASGSVPITVNPQPSTSSSLTVK